MTDSLMPDLNGTVCAAAGCIEVGDTIATVHLTVPHELGFPDPTVLLEAPICAEHAHKLRAGARLDDLTTAGDW